ncbi:MAG: hemin uptake protein HemP [Betaproteobacteria bacterium]|nr:hemin uptake protein HemP [Betaproteobacteria bacterium]
MIPPPKRVAKPRPKPPEPTPALTASLEAPSLVLAPAPLVHEASGESRTRARIEITSTELFAGNREIQIRHAGEIYILRRTSKGKLILTK